MSAIVAESRSIVFAPRAGHHVTKSIRIRNAARFIEASPGVSSARCRDSVASPVLFVALRFDRERTEGDHTARAVLAVAVRDSELDGILFARSFERDGDRHDSHRGCHRQHDQPSRQPAQDCHHEPHPAPMSTHRPLRDLVFLIQYLFTKGVSSRPQWCGSGVPVQARPCASSSLYNPMPVQAQIASVSLFRAGFPGDAEILRLV